MVRVYAWSEFVIAPPVKSKNWPIMMVASAIANTVIIRQGFIAFGADNPPIGAAETAAVR